MEIGDKLYVKKHFSKMIHQDLGLFDYTYKFKPGDIYEIIDTEFFALDYDEDVLFLRKFNEETIHDIHFGITEISTYFYTEKEMRKLKLKRLSSSQIELKLKN